MNCDLDFDQPRKLPVRLLVVALRFCYVTSVIKTTFKRCLNYV
jgi:hypothetical protein